MGHGQSLGHSVCVVADFFARLPLPAKANEVDNIEMARIAKNTFFILYFLNLKYCLLIGETIYFPAGASNQISRMPGDYRFEEVFFFSTEKLIRVQEKFFQLYKSYPKHKP